MFDVLENIKNQISKGKKVKLTIEEAEDVIQCFSLLKEIHEEIDKGNDTPLGWMYQVDTLLGYNYEPGN